MGVTEGDLQVGGIDDVDVILENCTIRCCRCSHIINILTFFRSDLPEAQKMYCLDISSKLLLHSTTVLLSLHRPQKVWPSVEELTMLMISSVKGVCVLRAIFTL